MTLSFVSSRVLTRSTFLHPTRARAFSSSIRRSSDESNPSLAFRQGPSPPKLPKEEQEIFEKLQQQSTGAFSTPRATPQVNQSPDFEAVKIEAKGDGGELHPDTKTGLKPEFEGEKNPKTGEVGGPKNEPLRWGSGGDWSYGGRVTDF